MTRVVISPHLDDAVLSCAHALMDNDAHVITVCAGIPAVDAPLSAWDAASGATSADARARERLAEDDAALSLLGVTTTRLDELGEHYRGAPFDVRRVAAQLAPLVAGFDEVWLPAGVGGHRAHVGTSLAARDAVRHHPQLDVVVYVDLPYALAFGWPGTRDGLEHELRQLGHEPAQLTPTVHDLTEQEQRLKQAAARCYRTQLALLEMTPDGRFADPRADAQELAYRRRC